MKVRGDVVNGYQVGSRSKRLIDVWPSNGLPHEGLSGRNQRGRMLGAQASANRRAVTHRGRSRAAVRQVSGETSQRGWGQVRQASRARVRYDRPAGLGSGETGQQG